MAYRVRKNKPHTKRLSTLWISFTLLDIWLHKTALQQILSNLAQLGHKTCLLSVRSRYPYQNNDPSVRVHAVPIRYVPFVSTLMYTVLLGLTLPIFSIISKPDFVIFEPDINIMSFFPSVIVFKLRKIKSVLDIRTVTVEAVGLRGLLRRFSFPVSVLIAKKLFDGITIITPAMKEKLCNDFDLKPEKVGVWTSGVSESLFNPAKFSFERAELRKQFGLFDKFIVFYHGVVTATRGITETVSALKLLVPEYPDIVFFILGSGPLIPALRAQIQRENLERNVFIANPVDQTEVPKFITMSDIGIVPLPNHPYWRLQSPLKLLEYLAMEKVVVLTDIPAHRAVIGEANCGIYISSIEPKEIARAIKWAYSQREKLSEWGRGGRKIVIEKYTWQKVARDLENYLLSIKQN